MEWFVLFCALLISALLWRQNEERKRIESLKETLLHEANIYVKKILDAKSLEPIPSRIILKSNEVAFLECNSTLLETRSVRYFQSNGAGIRVAKRLYFGSRSGKSYNQDELKHIDAGTLTLTNKRLVFNGSGNDRNIPIQKILAVNLFVDAIRISVETRQKSIVLMVPNPLVWATTIKIITDSADPLNLQITEADYKLCFDD
jgi:hypothetical protein